MGIKVIFADDDLLIRRLYVPHLARAGFEVIEAMNGNDVLQKALAQRPGLIIMDIMMPDTDGLSALRNLKKEETTKDIPVIIISEKVTEMTTREASISGAVSFMSKPFSSAQLIDAAKKLLPSA
jgi:DNA-binding response OmpR family regulator